jgi:hypothetical protein
LILKCFNSLQDSGNSLFGFNLLYWLPVQPVWELTLAKNIGTPSLV